MSENQNGDGQTPPQTAGNRVEECKKFIDAFKRCREEDGNNIILVIKTLPPINGILGRGHTYRRLLKFCIANNLLNEKDTYAGSLSKKQLSEFHDSAIAASSNDRTFTGMCQAVLHPFELELERTTVLSITPTNNNSNKIALLAWLVVSDSAKPIWEELQKESDPTFRVQLLTKTTKGILDWKTSMFEQLCNTAESIKNSPEIDLSLFDVSHIGPEAAAAMSHFSPGQATLDDPKWLQTNYITMVNLHSKLLNNLDSSGSATPAGAMERRICCFNTFLRPGGVRTNLNLFYCFVVWENAVARQSKTIPWLSRDHLFKAGRESISNNSSSKFRGNHSVDLHNEEENSAVSRKETLMPPFTPQSRVSNVNSSNVDQRSVSAKNQVMSPIILQSIEQSLAVDLFDSDSSVPLPRGSQMSLLQKRKAEYYAQEVKRINTEQCLSIMKNPAIYNLLSPEEQNQIRQKLLDNILG